MIALEPEIVDLPNLSPGEKRHLGAVEKRIAAGLQTFREVGAGLLEIRDARLYRETHSSFEAYCAERWGMERGRAYQLIDSAKVITMLGDPSALTNEAQARELARLTDQPEVAKRVWALAEAQARQSNKPVTANLIRLVRADVLDPSSNGNGHVTHTDRLITDISRLGVSLVRWKEAKPNIGQRNKVKAALGQVVGLL